MALVADVLDISSTNQIVAVRDGATGRFKSYPLSSYVDHEFTLDYFLFRIGIEAYQRPFSTLTIQGVQPADFDAAQLALSEVLNPCCEISITPTEPNTTSGIFTTVDNQTITIENGMVIDISSNI